MAARGDGKVVVKVVLPALGVLFLGIVFILVGSSLVAAGFLPWPLPKPG